MRKHNHQGAQLTDLAFLLIIFFILLTGAGTLSRLALDVDYESRDSTRLPEGENPFVIRLEITQEGTWMRQGAILDTESLGRLLGENNPGGESEAILQLVIADEAPWEAVVSAISIARNHQVTAIAMGEPYHAQ
jgi:hypothetical protein